MDWTVAGAENLCTMNANPSVLIVVTSHTQGQGGRYERAAMWQPHVVRDGRLVTGQNPASSRGTAEQTLRALAR